MFLYYRFFKKAIVHSVTSFGGYYLKWLEDGWTSRNSTKDRANEVSFKPWYTNQLYVN